MALDVLAAGEPRPLTIRASRMAPRRAIVLGVVQLLMVLHVVVWWLSVKYGWFGGNTLTPVEPSESQETVISGTINAGFLFFALAILSTLVFGRWFCGWGCHVVLLQDLCAWMMKKIGIHPRPFRSRLLVYGPLLMALYMFVWPAVKRLLGWIGRSMGYDWFVMPPWRVQWHLVDNAFWETFPSAAVAVPFLFVCGFVTVYFLGAKGFCTYGCPYGAVFAPVDRISRGRIRVTDACEGCGHCTAVCTSNVRVHDEVRTYGMVVDPGCMKCLDCVSVCPNDALYFGFGSSAVGVTPSGDRPIKRKFDLTLPEEVTIFGLMIVLFLVFNLLYGKVPALMAAGIAPTLTYLFWKAWRTMRDANASLHQYRLKYRGRLTKSGVVFLSAVALLIVFTGHSALVRSLQLAADHYHDRVSMPLDVVLSTDRPPLDDASARAARQAIALYERVSNVGLVTPMRNHVRTARLYLCLGEFAAAKEPIMAALPEAGDVEAIYRMAFFALASGGSADHATAFGEQVLIQHGGFKVLGHEVMRAAVKRGLSAAQAGRLDEAIALFERAIRIDEYSAAAHGYLGIALLRTGRTGKGIAALERGLTIEPENVAMLRTLAWVLATHPDPATRNGERALELARRAEELTDGADPKVLDTLGAALAQVGRFEEAAQAAERGAAIVENAMIRSEMIARATMYRERRPYVQENR